MILYNVTVIIEESVENEWLHWMKQEHIPEVMATGIFTSHRMCKVIDSPNEGATFSIQYFCDSLEDINRYQQHHAPALQQKHQDKFDQKFVAFRSLMEIVEDSTK